jgi:hypothetical protein
VDLLVVVPSPTCPDSFRPQQSSARVNVMPQASSEPVAMTLNFSAVVTAVGVPVQGIGLALKVHVFGSVAVVPSWPLRFGPQQYAVPSVARPQVESKMLLPIPGTTVLNDTPPTMAVGRFDNVPGGPAPFEPNAKSAPQQ